MHAWERAEAKAASEGGVAGALGNQWSVKYRNLNLCAVKGSTVVMEATYTHPTDVTVINRFWLINPVKGKESTDLHNESGYSGRVEYLGDKQNHFSLRLSDVKKSDEHMYYLKFRTTGGGYTGFPGVTLRVTGFDQKKPPVKSHFLHSYYLISLFSKNLSVSNNSSDPPMGASMSISISSNVVEGRSVTLTCSSDANSPVETCEWFNEKQLSPVGSGQSYRALQSGLYYCEALNKLGSERSAAVSTSVNGGSVIVYVAVGLFGHAALLSALFWLRWKRQKKKEVEGAHQYKDKKKSWLSCEKEVLEVEQVEKILETWRYMLERRGMKVSMRKTEYMCLSHTDLQVAVRRWRSSGTWGQQCKVMESVLEK
ncbi:B-cell receptor CD22-like [Silurus meridionalis]|nr:B-cell receptor CD22-like [Silurus meridionalis]